MSYTRMSYTRIDAPVTGLPAPDGVRRDVDDAFVPADPLNTDWQAYQAWLKAGNTPAEPGSPTTDPAPTAAPAKT